MNREYYEKQYDLSTAQAADRFTVSGYNYLDIITDGAINPRSNIEQDYLFLTFNDKYKLLIDQEVRNVDITKWDFADFTNAAHGTPRDLENGYGKIYFILKRSMFTELKKVKHNPSFQCAVDVAAGTEEWLWAGVMRPNASYTLAIPFIPRGYTRICSIIKVQAGISYDNTVRGYYNEPSTEFNNIYTVSDNVYNRQDLNSFSRFSFILDNNDGAQRNFRVQCQLTGRGYQ